MWMREVPSTPGADAEINGRFLGNNEFLQGRFGAIAKLNYDATLQLELRRLLHVSRLGGAHMLDRSLPTPAGAVHPARRAVHIKPPKPGMPGL